MTDHRRQKTDDSRAIKSVRGTRDLLPPETAVWNFVEAAVRDVFRVYNFHEIRTPILEDLALFQRSVGEETDIVGKAMFAWEDRARGDLVSQVCGALATAAKGEEEKAFVETLRRGQWLELRPENTVG